MPLNPTALRAGFNKFMDPDASEFVAWPNSITESAEKWAQALVDYATAIVPPSTTVSAAKAAYIPVHSAISNSAGNGFVQLAAAHNAFVTALALGQITGVFVVSTPPVFTPADFIGVATGMTGTPTPAILTALVSMIDAKFRTGFCVTAPPASATVPWT